MLWALRALGALVAWAQVREYKDSWVKNNAELMVKEFSSTLACHQDAEESFCDGWVRENNLKSVSFRL